MKVVLQTPTQLVVHDGVLKTVVVGTVFAGLGAGGMTLWIVDPTGWTGNGGAWLIYLVGGVFIAVGIALLALSADRRYVIDRAAGTVRFVAQRLTHRTSREYALADLQDVALERSAGGPDQSNPCYRIVFLTKAGTRLPWTPYSTNDQGAHAVCALAVRVFCGWASGASVSDAAPAPGRASGQPIDVPWGYIGSFLGIFVAVGLALFGMGVYRVATWQPVSARVLSTGIKAVAGDEGTSYMPTVQYEYSFDGAQYVGSGVMPITMSAGRGWAEKLRNRFRPGESVTAYVNPARPSKAYLVHEVSLLPLLFVVVPLALAALLAWIVRVQRRLVRVMETFPVPVVDA